MGAADIARQPLARTPERLPDYGERARIGMITPHRNVVAEPDARAVFPNGVSLHVTRLELAGTSPAQLMAMTDGVELAASLLGEAPLDLIVFHCTAVSTQDPALGEQLVGRIRAASGKPALATSQALLAALDVLRAKRIVMLTPYPQAINDAEVAFFAHFGIEMLAEQGLALPREVSTASVTPEEWRERLLAMRDERADAYFLSCTNIRALPVIETLEAELGAPVISSNQAMLWRALRMAGIADAIAGYGTLLRAH